MMTAPWSTQLFLGVTAVNVQNVGCTYVRMTLLSSRDI